MKINNRKRSNFFKAMFKKFGFYKESETLYKEEELTRYINKIFEQQEKERIVRWLVNSIRESLDLDTVLEKTVEEVGRLLKVDRCLIALFYKETEKFNFRNEYRINNEIMSVLDNLEDAIRKILEPRHEFMINSFQTVVINDIEQEKLSPEASSFIKKFGIKSYIIVPIVDKNELSGIIIVHQVKNKRKWEDAHEEILKDIGSQIAIAIRQAILYAKVQESTRLKSEFLFSMSHELRTPLNAIIGFSEMLLCEDYGQLSEKQTKFIKNISLSGEHLLRLVNDILDLSKIESGNMEINYEIFNIYQAIWETVSVLNSLAEKKNINIEMDVDNKLCINADLRRFKQIMYNLLSNAVKFTEDNGKVKVIACLEESRLRVEVHDTGIGIPAKDRDKIFKNFRQLDSSLTRKQEGTGLGLTLTKKFIELHKGIIDFESKEGQGTKFWFTLPGVVSQTPA
ncbi:MAG: hypothetical protein A2Y25_03385 [Candidatus Melainabacteria bacterium GWF2_37_15]|nr:MAG: hypothetical protein A2Y25_03385 [Candidatus Melainabacteria bacterium GWF2_37_15]